MLFDVLAAPALCWHCVCLTRCRHIQEADIHERRGRQIKAGRNTQQQGLLELALAAAAAAVLSGLPAVVSQERLPQVLFVCRCARAGWCGCSCADSSGLDRSSRGGGRLGACLDVC